VEPYSIVGGNPAVTIKKGFSDEIIELLLKLQWWNWDEKKIFKNLDALVSANDIVTLKNWALEIFPAQRVEKPIPSTSSK
jgi:virginiamycin A acetyltransferase